MDRNINEEKNTRKAVLSLSARRAWIEISGSTKPRARRAVALRKESVDRNSDGVVSGSADYVSLSARRAWIEMRKITITVDEGTRRSPQGERG